MQEGDSFVYLAKLKGSAYEMGKAYGELFSDELKQQLSNIALLYPSIIESILPGLGLSKDIVALLDDDQLL